MLTQFRRARNLQRYRQIVAVLARHGFGSVLENLQVDRYFPIPTNLFKQRVRPGHLSPAEHLRLAFEELGPTFIKLGQVLSTRPDLFPPEYIVELTKLQEQVPPTPWQEVLNLIHKEYGRDPQAIFESINSVPIGSASLAQVHAAVLKDGSQVVVKVQRPGISRTIDADLEILSDLAALAQRTAWGKLYNPVEIVAQFAFTLKNELDYRREGLNADRFRQNFQSESHLYIPNIYWDLSTSRILVMERLQGIRIDDNQGLDDAGYDRHEVAMVAAKIIASEIMDHGFFHADPHPGNFLIISPPVPGSPQAFGSNGKPKSDEPAGKVVVIGAMDFGMVGHISKSDRMNLLQVFALSAKMDAQGVVEHMLRIGAVSSQIDMQGLERDVDRILHHYKGLPAKWMQTQRVMNDMMQVAFRYRINLPPDLWLLFKTLIMMDGLAHRLDPDFDLFGVFTPHVREILAEMHMPWVWGPTFLSDLESLGYALRDMPGISESLLRGLQRGHLPFSFTLGANKETLDRMDRISTRISLSVMVAAFILGLAILFPVASGNTFALLLVAVGFLSALSLGLWVVISILRSGK
jgi:ubiquinone biosynthesis protein